MKSSYSKYLKLAVLALALPFIYGCGAGAGVGSLVGFLFGSGGSGVGPITIASGPGLDVGASSVASLVNPEPASMMLLGGGLMAMSYFKSKTSRRKK